MLLARLSGGLGNQLFQFATFYQISFLTKNKLIVYLGFYSKNIRNNTRRLSHISRINQGTIKVLNYNFIFEVLFKTIFKILIFRHTDPRKLKSDIRIGFLDGYFQDFTFFDSNEELKDKIRDTFSSSKTMKKTIGVHVRRGDYLLNENKKYFKNCEIKYYIDSISFISTELNIKEFDVLVFSDDIQWCKKNLSFGPKTKFINRDELSDFKMMSRCEHLIISNSTYSWWAAYINSSSNRIICAPKYWYSDTKKNFQYPENWILINN